jgi:plastocyanin
LHVRSLKLLALPTLAAVAAALVVPLTSSAAKKPKAMALKATVGPGFTISVTAGKKKGNFVAQPGTYTITVYDKSNIHNFHLIGPGVNKKTGVAAKGTYKWKLKLKTGTYRYVCDPHASIMKGKFRISSF